MIEPPSSDSKVETLLQRFPGPVTLSGERSGELTLDADGFQQRIPLIHTKASWKDVSDFEVATIYSPFGGKAGSVVWYHDKTRESWWPHRIWRLRANAGINPVQELSIEQLAELLKRWRDRALTQGN
jgi:hypothetical protein